MLTKNYLEKLISIFLHSDSKTYDKLLHMQNCIREIAVQHMEINDDLLKLSKVFLVQMRETNLSKNLLYTRILMNRIA